MKQRRILAIMVCMILVASMAVVASAATTATLFSQKADGYQCVGTGSIDGSKATATLSAKAIPMQPIIPGVDCESSIVIVAYDTSGQYIGLASSGGDVNATLTYSAGKTVGTSYNSFVFNNIGLGTYVLSAN